MIDEVGDVVGVSPIATVLALFIDAVHETRDALADRCTTKVIED